MTDNETTRREKSKKEIISDIRKNYAQVEEALVKQLYMKHSLHGTTIGSAREDIWKQLFEMIIPKKFVIEQSVFVIDSTFRNDNSQIGISKEVDLAIIDETYTPYIFRFGRIKFVPIEAVAVVVECKSKDSSANHLKDWISRIEELITSDVGIARMVSFVQAKEKGESEKPKTQTATKPIKIFCGLKSSSIAKEMADKFDFVLTACEAKNKIRIEPSKRRELIEDWLIHLNTPNQIFLNNSEIPNYKLSEHYRVYEKDENGKETDCSLLSFNFQLNQLLMLINNPILFPHLAYVNMFNEIENEER